MFTFSSANAKKKKNSDALVVFSQIFGACPVTKDLYLQTVAARSVCWNVTLLAVYRILFTWFLVKLFVWPVTKDLQTVAVRS